MTPAERIQIYVPEHLAEITEGGDSLSGRIATILDRYGELLKRHRPELTRKQWIMICEAVAGDVGERRADRLMTALDAKLGTYLTHGSAVGFPAGFGTIADYASALAVVEAAERAWLHWESGPDAALKAAGVTPASPLP